MEKNYISRKCQLCGIAAFSVGDDPDFSAFNRSAFRFSVISMSRENSSAVRRRRSIRIFFDDRRKKESGHSRRGFLSRETRERGELCKLQHRNHQPTTTLLDSHRPTHLSRPLPIFPKITLCYIECLKISRFYCLVLFRWLRGWFHEVVKYRVSRKRESISSFLECFPVFIVRRTSRVLLRSSAKQRRRCVRQLGGKGVFA